jgi:death-on-curing protein
LLAEFGGSPGVRDEGLLVSALSRPQSHACAKPSLCDLTASYPLRSRQESSVRGGNKRVGFATAVLLLEINGARFEAGEVDAVTLALAAGELDEVGYPDWLEANARNTRRQR